MSAVETKESVHHRNMLLSDCRSLLAINQKKIRDYARIGEIIDQLRGKPFDLTWVRIRESLGETTYTSARLCVKLSQNASESDVNGMDSVGVSWRGVMIWLGVDVKSQADELLREILSGMTNSTEIRRYVEHNFDKPVKSRNYKQAEHLAECFENRLLKVDASADAIESYLGSRVWTLQSSTRSGLVASINHTIEKLKKAQDSLIL